MEINPVKSPDIIIPSYNTTNSSQTANSGKSDVRDVANVSVKLTDSLEETTDKTDKKNKKEPQENEVQELTEAMNKFMTSINADLQFSMHQRTQRLMVQMVDSKDKKVLKEFPPKEFLDMVAKIRDYVGAILDKKI